MVVNMSLKNDLESKYIKIETDSKILVKNKQMDEYQVEEKAFVVEEVNNVIKEVLRFN